MAHRPMTRPEEMLVEHRTRFGHSSTFVELADGRILHNAAGTFTVSADGGMTWSEPAGRQDRDGDPVHPMTEPSLVNLSGNGVGLAGRMYDRDAVQAGSCSATSGFPSPITLSIPLSAASMSCIRTTTEGRPQPTALAASNAPASINTLPNGHLLCVWNQENEAEVNLGYNRTRISAAVSRNGGGVWEFFQNVESLHEETRVEPGPIRHISQKEIHYRPGSPAPVREAAHIEAIDTFGRWSYPSVLVLPDRVLIAHTFTQWDDDADKALPLQSSRQEGGCNQKLKVLPLTWFYGGKEPADNPFLPRAYEPAQP